MKYALCLLVTNNVIDAGEFSQLALSKEEKELVDRELSGTNLELINLKDSKYEDRANELERQSANLDRDTKARVKAAAQNNSAVAVAAQDRINGKGKKKKAQPVKKKTPVKKSKPKTKKKKATKKKSKK